MSDKEIAKQMSKIEARQGILEQGVQSVTKGFATAIPLRFPVKGNFENSFLDVRPGRDRLILPAC